MHICGASKWPQSSNAVSRQSPACFLPRLQSGQTTAGYCRHAAVRFLGPPAVPLSRFWVEGSPTKIDYIKKLVPAYSNLSAGGPGFLERGYAGIARKRVPFLPMRAKKWSSSRQPCKSCWRRSRKAGSGLAGGGGGGSQMVWMVLKRSQKEASHLLEENCFFCGNMWRKPTFNGLPQAILVPQTRIVLPPVARFFGGEEGAAVVQQKLLLGAPLARPFLRCVQARGMDFLRLGAGKRPSCVHPANRRVWSF